MDQLAATDSADPDFQAWAEAFRRIAQHHELPLPSGAIQRLAEPLRAGDEVRSLELLADRYGLRLKVSPPEQGMLSGSRLPVAVRLKDGSIGVLTALSAADQATVVFSGDGGLPVSIPLPILLDQTELIAAATPTRSVPDSGGSVLPEGYRADWFRKLALTDLGSYGHVVLASLVANILSLAGVLFSMQVYDRVVPAQSHNTLYVLFAGVLLALGFDFAMRRVRTEIIDIAGKRADIRLSDLIFGHALRVKNQARPKATGTFIAQLRDVEQVRELMTSTTVAALADLPFFILFLVLLWVIGAAMAVIPAAALVLLVIPGLLAQRPLSACADRSMRESSLRNAMLVEAVQGIEDIKALQAEDHFQRRWTMLSALTAEAQLRARRITGGLAAWSHCVQAATFAVVVFIGAPALMSGDMTTGALVACSILSSRMIAPMGQLAQILGKLQQAKVGLRGLDAIMQLPVDHPATESRVSAAALAGNYRFRAASFDYGEASGRPALHIDQLHLGAGERLAVLGRNGSGKSTLILALAGMIEPSSGEVLLDNLALGQIDPADLRRDVGLLGQNSRLFHGTIRENLTLGAPHATQEALLDALAMVGADDFIARLTLGLNHPVLEGGRGLSGGQQQALLLARLLIRNPRIVLLDEPTAAMDEATERKFIDAFQQWSAGRTVVIATHRMRVLDLVDRVIGMEGGRVVLDEARDAALKRLLGVDRVIPRARRPAVPPVRPAARIGA